MRTSLIIILMLTLLGCHTPYGYQSKGFFLETNPPKDQPLFATALPHRPNDLPKLTGGNHNYFVWSTVRYNVIIDDEQQFGSYRTISQEEIRHLDPVELQYVRTQGNLLNNYLFFLDDYRFIYLSEDDHRNEISYGQIPVYFDEDQYKVPRDAGSSFNQLLRGYYVLDGDQLFLDFGSVNHFYVKATRHGQTITFDSIYIPRRKVLKGAGIDQDYVPFVGMLGDNAQPHFEVPDTDGLIRWPMFTLNSGFLWGNPKVEKRNPLHQQILEQDSQYGKALYEQVTDIQYDFSDRQHPVRRYTLEVVDLSGQSTFLKITEDLVDVATW
ncbi:MAG: hypothetical protein R2787_14820 [Saprospiraceae bacterium]